MWTRLQRRRRTFSPGIINHCVGEEWYCLGHKKRKLIGQRLNIEQADAAANGSFSILQWIPGKADTRLKILQRWVVKERIPQVRQGRGVRDVPQSRQLAASLADHRRHFVAPAAV